jgi:DNA primase
MASPTRMSQIPEIKEKLDIVNIIGERIKLQRRGKNFLGLCPFHSEKTPSFNVSPDMQRYICFGCKRKGDVFEFIQEFDRLTFPETLEYLADKAGVKLEKLTPDPQEKMRKDMFAALELAQRYFSYLLVEHAVGEPARQYLEGRGLSPSLAKQFGLGFAPDNWDTLTTYLMKKKFPADVIVSAGLALAGKSGRPYDRFRGRIMFPLHDHRGRVVGFSGRILDTEAKEAKYINTPETSLYHKRNLLYGYWQNLNFIREAESVIITEGEFDVLSSVQAHVQNIVAVKGSALTEEQVRTLARTVQTIYLALDADSAGVEATKRAIEIVQPFPVALRVIPLTGGKDPDDLARADAAAWRETIKQHISAFEYVLDHTIKEHDIHTPDGLKKATNIMLGLLNKVEHIVERSFYLRQLAERLHVSESVLEEQWQQFQRQAQLSTIGRARQPDTETSTQEQPEAQDSTGRYFLQLVLQFPEAAPQVMTQVQAEWFLETSLQRLWTHWHTWYNNSAPAHRDVQHWSRTVPAELQEVLSDVYLAEVPISETDTASRELAVTTTQLQQRYKKSRLHELEQKLSALQRKDALTDGETLIVKELEQELQKLLVQ